MIVDNKSHSRNVLESVNYSTEQWELLRYRLSHRSVRSLCEDKKKELTPVGLRQEIVRK